jgi:hypothetical protein
MRKNVASRFCAAASCLALLASPALAQKANQLTNLNGLSPDRAESALTARGFTYADSHSNSMGYTYSYWWQANGRNCISVEANNGLVESVTDAPASDCHQKASNGNAAAAVGVVAGVAILGALLSHKSHHHSDRNHSSDAVAEQQYERGYDDGLHNASYHNYDRSEQYSSGCQAGVDERNANLRHHGGRGGYAGFAQINELNGARAAGGMSTLEQRGFRQVDNFTSGNTRYSIQYRPQSRQCVQVTIADGRFYDVRDIQQHPRCR